MATELDPILVRALNLLHSKHPKALEELCALRDEVLGKKPECPPEKKKEEIKESAQVETVKKTPAVAVRPPEVITISSDSDGPAFIEELPEPSANILGQDEADGLTETVEVESSSLSKKAHADDEEMIEMVEELGSGFFEETLEELSSSNLLMKRRRPKMEINTGKTILDDLEVASRESSPDHEMSADLGLAKCLVCSSGKMDMDGNQLVECHECHEMYHQNCHKPRITDQSINDPRHVWYCRNCSKQLKQATSASTVPKLKSITSPGALFKPPTQSFKPPLRVETSKPAIFSPTSPSVNQSFIIPNLTTNTASSGSNSGGLKSPGNVNPRDVARNSLKRLQLVKKKAAAKNQQQRFNKR